MGGNALKNCVTRRYNSDEYDALSFEIGRKLIDNGIICTRIPSYFSKESHGDLDLLVKAETLPPNWPEKIVEWFEPKEWIKNGNVLSFEYNQFQVDLVVTPEEDWVSSFQYFAFNDLGNLIGRVAHSMGLKLGHDGLTYKWRLSNDHVFKEITLLKDWKDILPVLGYSYERWAEGFETLEDIFKFVVSSPFFNKDIYQLHNRNHISRVRDKKRKTYMSFLQWIETYKETPTQRFGTVHHPRPNEGKEGWLRYLFKEIPGFKEQYEATQAEYEREEEFKKRFNGNLVRDWTGLDGKELGELMKWIKNNTDPVLFKKNVLVLNPICLERLVHYYKDKWLKEI